uniref:G-protein coupled receptors family 1 profile domain-containing protein n=1 Tax=Plectus sambesii TaxID=2011161 RepID=A0A914WS59_9BILA
MARERKVSSSRAPSACVEHVEGGPSASDFITGFNYGTMGFEQSARESGAAPAERQWTTWPPALLARQTPHGLHSRTRCSDLRLSGRGTDLLIEGGEESAAAARDNMASNASIAESAPSMGAVIALVAYCYILPTICVLGIVGNATNLMTLASPRLRAVSYMYLRALAVADLLCMVFVLMFVSGEIMKRVGVELNSYEYAFYQAHFMLSMINWAISAGVFVVIALTLERFVSIVFPIHFRSWNSPKRACRAIIIAYLIPTLLYLPYALWRHEVIADEQPDGAIHYRVSDSGHTRSVIWQAYELIREVLIRLMPIAILCILNVQIIIAFRKRQQMRARLTNRAPSTRGGSMRSRNSGAGNASGAETGKRDDSLLFLLAGIVVMFFICNIPAAANLLFINETVKKRADYQIFRAVANLLEITNHAAQFYVFCACSSEYRATFLEKFPCFKHAYGNGARLRSYIRKRISTAQSSSGDRADEYSSELPVLHSTGGGKTALLRKPAKDSPSMPESHCAITEYDDNGSAARRHSVAVAESNCPLLKYASTAGTTVDFVDSEVDGSRRTITTIADINGTTYL